MGGNPGFLRMFDCERKTVMLFRRKPAGGSDTWLVVGLGNPGPEYENTRHNCGFRVLDCLAERWQLSFQKRKWKGVLAETRWEGRRVVLLKPLTYMNCSGESVRAAMDWYHIAEDHLVVIYDDIDLALGAIRVRPKGSAGSHNGMKSVLQHTEGDCFPRIRVGIGSRPAQMDLANYVLGRFSGEEERQLQPALEHAADALLCVMEKGTEQAMSRYNGLK